MIGLDFFIAGIALAQAEIKAEIKAERKLIDTMRAALTPEQFAEWHAAHLADKERRRLEAVAERRHRELCDAIRSTSFWRFGG